MKYAKLHGCQNAYIYADSREITGEPAAIARAVAAPPPRGIGADGLITYGPSDVADVRMTVYNADGSRAAMCGNGARALAKWILDNDPAIGKTISTAAPLAALAERLAPLAGAFAQALTGRGVPADAPLAVRSLSVETDSGVKTITALLRDGAVIVAAVHAGLATLRLDGIGPAQPRIDGDRMVDVPLTAAGATVQVTCVLVGNLHAVVFVPDTDAFPFGTYGPALECHAIFPDRVNVHFVTVEHRSRLRMRPWERGSGPTPACGTGACAALAAAVVRGAAELEAEIVQPGGSVCVCLIPDDPDQWHAHLIGPAELVETGSWPTGI
ncbi:MAG TPA: hypothetical protein P5572_09160 [Phycisphaerae bacterium]|nr:hypothetical protein [Phycisphaerales bacterium]HRX85173.1 hypothetical protein [Phycisphaerae bacterium]